MGAKNLLSAPPLTSAFLDENGMASKAWAIFFRDNYRRVGFKGDNAIDNNKAEVDAELLDLNSTLAQTIITVNQNVINIDVNKTNITVNESAIIVNADNLATHEALSIAHDSNGDIVGKLDLSTESLVGLVKQMALIADAVASTVSVTSPDIAAAPATYNQAYTDTVKDLANEMKADINTLVTDVNNAVTKINAILAETITSGQMNNV